MALLLEVGKGPSGYDIENQKKKIGRTKSKLF